jgi:hypothetical protein
MATAEKSKNQTKSKQAAAGRGGRRPGSGRPKGAATKKTREIADRAAAEGITPLEYMLQIMRRETAHEDPKVEVARETLAFEAAKAAAPYMHPRLAAVEHTGADGKDLIPSAPVFEIVLSK